MPPITVKRLLTLERFDEQAMLACTISRMQKRGKACAGLLRNSLLGELVSPLPIGSTHTMKQRSGPAPCPARYEKVQAVMIARQRNRHQHRVVARLAELAMRDVAQLESAESPRRSPA